MKLLPTPIHCHEALTKILSVKCKCEGSWAQHPQAMTLSEVIDTQKAVAQYFKTTIENFVEQDKRRAETKS